MSLKRNFPAVLVNMMADNKALWLTSRNQPSRQPIIPYVCLAFFFFFIILLVFLEVMLSRLLVVVYGRHGNPQGVATSTAISGNAKAGQRPRVLA